MKKLVKMVFIFIFLISFSAYYAQASDVELLIKKLVEKRILTQEDAKELIEEIRQESVKQESVKAEEKSKQAAIPKWVGKTKVKGDLRFRYEDKDLETGEKTETKRGRIRLRLGAETEVNDKVTAGLGFASGTSGWDSARSTNQTLGDNFGSKEIVID